MSAEGSLLAASLLDGAPRIGKPDRLARALQAAIDRMAERGGGSLVLGPGTWETGALVLKSGVGLVLERGAVLQGSGDPCDYPVRMCRWEGKTMLAHAPLIGAEGAKGVSVSGPGLIDGRGKGWWEAFRAGRLERPRPRLIAFESCSDVLLDGFSCKDSPSWTINPVRCERVAIRGIRIENPPDSPNTDGIDPDSCSDVRISDCSISAGDDCIAVKAGVEHEAEYYRRPSSGICVTNCRFESGHGGVVIGSEMSGGIRDIVVANCSFHGTDRGIRFKSRRRRGGRIEAMSFSNLVMRGVSCPIAVNFYYGCGAWGDPFVADKSARPFDGGTPSMAHVRFSEIVATEARLCAAFLYGLPESPLADISLSGCDFSMVEGDVEEAQVEMGDGLPSMARRGVFARNARGLALDSVRVFNALGPEFDLEGVE
jgi:polygalacturonase